MAELTNLGTEAPDLDLPAAGSALTRVRVMPGFVPGDSAYVYRGEIDPDPLGVEPRSRERLLPDTPLYYTQPTFFSSATTLTNQGTDGTNGDVGFEASSLTGLPAGDRHMSFPGVATNFLSVPDAANLDITVSIEITVRMSAEWDNRLANQRIVAKGSTTRAYELFLGFDTQHGCLGFARDASNIAHSNMKVPFLPDHPGWVRVTYNSGTSQVKFYTAPDQTAEPSSWTQLGTTQTLTGTMAVNTEVLRIGTLSGTTDMFKGRIYNVIIRNADTAGTTVLNIDIPTDTAAMTQDVTTTFTATSGQTVTLTKSGTPPATVRVMPVGTSTYQTGHRWGYTSANLPTLEVSPNQLKLFWVRAFVGGYSTARRQLFPVFSINGPYAPNSLSMILDTFKGEMMVSVRGSTTSGISELFATGDGVLTSAAGTTIFALALAEVDGVTYAWNVKYSSVNGFTYDVLGGTGSPFRWSASMTDIIPSTNELILWQGISGFSPTDAGVMNWDNFLLGEDPPEWLESNGPIEHVMTIVKDHLRAVASNVAAEYTVGDFWQASSDGTLEMATRGVEEGDCFAVKSINPTTWQHIPINHPTRRKTLYRPGYVTFGPPVTGWSAGAGDDAFMWLVASGWGDTTDYGLYAYDSTSDAFAMMLFGRDTTFGNGYVFLELDDDDGDFGFSEYKANLDGGHSLFDNGVSSPTLFAMAIDKNADTWTGWFYDADHGLTTMANEDLTPGNYDAINMDQIWFFGPEENEGYANMVVWGGGWTAGVGVIPTEEGLVELWERAVYGYPLGE